MTLFAHETKFWMRLIVWDLATWDAQSIYRADSEEMTEVYSCNFWPPMTMKED